MLKSSDENLHTVVKRSLDASKIPYSDICLIENSPATHPHITPPLETIHQELIFLKSFRRTNTPFIVDKPNQANLTALHFAILYGTPDAYNYLKLYGGQ